MQAWHQKTILDSDIQINIFIAEDTEFPPHWHEAVEMVYVLDDSLKIGVNNAVYSLDARDIFLVNGGDVHYFLPVTKPVKRIILHFELSLFESFTAIVKNKRFTRVLLKQTDCDRNEKGIRIHETLEKHILEILHEQKGKREGYKIVLKARLFDILVALLRYVPMETYSFNEINKKLNRLERLEQVFRYVEQSYDNNISLEQIASVANFSVYHFTRFFKETTGMTFIQYLNNFRVSKAAEYLMRSNTSITETAFKSGFGSIKNFNRTFKQIKGCSPSKYKKAIYDHL